MSKLIKFKFSGYDFQVIGEVKDIEVLSSLKCFSWKDEVASNFTILDPQSEALRLQAEAIAEERVNAAKKQENCWYEYYRKEQEKAKDLEKEIKKLKGENI